MRRSAVVIQHAALNACQDNPGKCASGHVCSSSHAHTCGCGCAGMLMLLPGPCLCGDSCNYTGTNIIATMMIWGQMCCKTQQKPSHANSTTLRTLC